MAVAASASQSSRWPKPGPEVDPERPVLGPEPRPAHAHDRAAAADVVDRRERLHREAGVAERVRADEQPEPDPLGRLGGRRERGVALEDRLVLVAEDREQVVPGPQVVEPELLGPAGGGEELGPGRGLAPQVQAQAQVGHRSLHPASVCGTHRARAWASSRTPVSFELQTNVCTRLRVPNRGSVRCAEGCGPVANRLRPPAARLGIGGVPDEEPSQGARPRGPGDPARGV